MRRAVGGYGVFWMDYEDHDKSMGACCCIRSLCRLIDAMLLELRESE